ncbi:hypothetical protein ACHAXM_005127 [Skeletonema potamos]
MTSKSINPPTFRVPTDSSNYEIWCLRAPAHLDVSEILNGVTLDVNTKLLDSDAADTSSHQTINTTLSKFKTKQDGQDYELTLGDASEINHLRLLLPDNEDDDTNTKKLKAHNTAFQRYINLTCVTTNAQEELVLAPARENAPRPAFGEVGINGSVPAMRLAYVPVPQKEGLKRRWAMPGSRMTTIKRVKVSPTTADDDYAEATSTVIPNSTAAVKVKKDDEDTPNTPKRAKKMKKKEKKEKKSKKTPKK